jgi:hypothetical protein
MKKPQILEDGRALAAIRAHRSVRIARETDRKLQTAPWLSFSVFLEKRTA